jgi:hypothetical protein
VLRVAGAEGFELFLVLEERRPIEAAVRLFVSEAFSISFLREARSMGLASSESAAPMATK